MEKKELVNQLIYDSTGKTQNTFSYECKPMQDEELI